MQKKEGSSFFIVLYSNKVKPVRTFFFSQRNLEITCLGLTNHYKTLTLLIIESHIQGNILFQNTSWEQTKVNWLQDTSKENDKNEFTYMSSKE